MVRKIIKMMPLVFFLTALIIAIYNLMQKESNYDLIILVLGLNMLGYCIDYYVD